MSAIPESRTRPCNVLVIGTGAAAFLLTDFDDVIALVDAGEITLQRMPGADFRCPILPNA